MRAILKCPRMENSKSALGIKNEKLIYKKVRYIDIDSWMIS